MASSKLKAKPLDRTTLYYGKFEYRVVVKNIDEYRQRIDEECSYCDAHPSTSQWRPRPDVEDWEYQLIENIFNLEKKYKVKQDYTVRREGKCRNIYTSNINIVNEILSFKPDVEITQVNLMPTGIKYFKRTPPSKYRAYMTNNKMSSEFKTDMLQYLSRTPDVRPSEAFFTFLNRISKYGYDAYLWDTYFVDYDDDKNLMMMMLMFPGAIGKKYKLEQK